MKIVLGIAIASLSFSAVAQMSVRANCEFNQAVGRCAVYNQWNRPMQCDLRAQGQVYSGAFLNVYESVVVYPGQYAYAYVQANNPQRDPLVNVSGSANCSM